MYRLAAFTAVIFLFLAVIPIAPPARADFWDGLAAYDAGDYRETFAQWRPLAASGDPEAQAALAGLYAQGLGVPRDLSRASHWFRRAAEQGHTIAQLNLGDYYARGYGVGRDKVRAWFWLSLAARQGNRWAANRRDAIESGMADATLNEARRLLADRRLRPE